MKQKALLLVIVAYIPEVAAKWNIYCFRVFPSETNCNDGNNGPLSWTARTNEKSDDGDEAFATKLKQDNNSLGVTKPLLPVLPGKPFLDAATNDVEPIWDKGGIALDREGHVRLEIPKTQLPDSVHWIGIGISFHW